MWLLLALAAAVFSALAETTRKRLVRDVDPVAVAFLTAAFSAAVLLPVVWVQGLPTTGEGFWWALVVSGGINAVAAVLVAEAYSTSDLSLVTPLTGLTPVFTLAVAAVVIGEVPSVLGGVGVVTVVAGTWILATSRADADGTAPLRALWRDRGARLMLLVAFLWGASSTYDKVGVLASAPVLWGFSVRATVAAATGVRVLSSRTARAAVAGLPARLWGFALLTGLAMGVMLVAQMTALTLGLAGYVIAVKRVSILLTVVAGGLLFRESHLRLRLAAAGVILLGLALLAVG